MILLITYDLHKPERDYLAVENVIKAENNWARIEESVWLVDTATPPERWQSNLQATAPDAAYFVVRLQRDWVAFGINEEVTGWLNDARRRW